MKKRALVFAALAVLLVFGIFALRRERSESAQRSSSSDAEGALSSATVVDSAPAQTLPAVPSTMPASPSLEQLGEQLVEGGEKFQSAGQKLIEIGTFDSIRTLIIGISKMPPSSESLGMIYSLYKFPDRRIAEWIGKVLSELPEDREQLDHFNMLCMVAGSKATPEALLSIAQAARQASSPFAKALQLQIITQASAPETTPTLIQLAQSRDLLQGQFESLDFAAATGLANQGRPDGVKFLFRQLATSSDPAAKSLYAQSIEKIEHPDTAPFLMDVAKGHDSALADTATRGMAMSVLSKLNDENAWHTLRDLKDDANGDISAMAGKALDKVSARTGFQFE